MKVSTLLRFSCLVFSCYSLRAGYVLSRAEQPTVDDALQVYFAPGVRAPGIKGCLSAPPPTYSIRVQSLKTSGGSEYTRQLVTTAALPCFENSTTKAFPDVTTIGNCAEATAKNSLNSFSWEAGVCTAYLAWRPQQRADCMDGGSKVVYVVKTRLTPFAGEIIVSGEINYSYLPRVTYDISYHYDSCGFSSSMHKGYKLLINGSDLLMLPEGSTEYNLNRQNHLCSGDVNISLWSVDADGNVNSNEVQRTIQSNSSHWYGLRTGACIYNSGRRSGYVDSVQYCNSSGNGTLYYAESDGEASTFLAALDEAGLPSNLMQFYVGLKYDRASKNWTWLGGLKMPGDDSAWKAPPADSMWQGARVMLDSESGHYKLIPISDNTARVAVVCYFKNP